VRLFVGTRNVGVSDVGDHDARHAPSVNQAVATANAKAR